MNFDKRSITKKSKALAFYNIRKKGTLYTIVFRVSLLLLLIIFLAGAGLFLGFARAIHDNTPVITIDSLTPDGEASILYDSNGEKIVSLDKKKIKQESVSLNEIPQDLQNAVISLEDPGYYNHSGINAYSLINGLFTDLTSDVPYGYTSIISEQLIENLDPDLMPNTNFFSRSEYRLRLHFQSYSLVSNASKPEIFEYYLNTISFGSGILGVESASRIYFEKSVSDLTLSECAILAATMSDPEEYNPLTQLDNNKSQRIFILEKMHEENYITDEMLSDALRENSYENIQSGRSESQIGLTAFEQEVLRKLYRDMKREYHISSTKFYTMLLYGGLKIYTTQDSDLQQSVEKIAANDANYPGEASDADVSITIINQSTGQVRAMIGSRSDQKSAINEATQETKQPGTLFHVLATYLPGIDSRTLTLASTYEDAPYQYLDSNESVVEDTDIYQGMTTIREALPAEMNLIASRAQSDVTAQTSYDYLTKLGFRHLVESAQDSNGNFTTDVQQSICNGQLINGVTNLEITRAVSTLGNEGYMNSVLLYTRVTDQRDTIIIESKSTTSHPIQATTAFLITDALKVEEEEQIKNSETAYFTGKTSERTTYWCTGYTPEITATVCLDYDDGRTFGSEDCELRIWKKVMNAAVDSTENVFVKPADLEKADICTESGKLAVSSICDNDPRGSCIVSEYFAQGTVPTTTCNTHIEVTICRESGMLISNECPKEDYIRRIYLSLPTGSSQTLDSRYTLPEKYASDERCALHGKKQE